MIDLSSTVDTLLDRTIAPGYGSLGLLIRRHLPDWPADPPRIDGQVVLVTGAASGLGLAACVGFARLGASVLVLARSQPRADQAAANVRAEVPGADVRGVVCDVSDLDALAGFARRFAEQEPRLDVLVNNAGVMPDHRRPRPTHYLIGPRESSPEAGRRLWDQCQSALDRAQAGRARSASTLGSR